MTHGLLKPICSVILSPAFKLAAAEGGKCTFRAIPSVVTSTTPVLAFAAVTVAGILCMPIMLSCIPFMSECMAPILSMPLVGVLSWATAKPLTAKASVRELNDESSALRRGSIWLSQR